MFDCHFMSKLTIEWVELVVYAAKQEHSCEILIIKNTKTSFRFYFGSVAVQIVFNPLQVLFS